MLGGGLGKQESCFIHVISQGNQRILVVRDKHFEIKGGDCLLSCFRLSPAQPFATHSSEHRDQRYKIEHSEQRKTTFVSSTLPK